MGDARLPQPSSRSHTPGDAPINCLGPMWNVAYELDGALRMLLLTTDDG